MKLRNKQTGEVIDYDRVVFIGNKDKLVVKDGEELRDWEDYEEPKECFWYIATDCETCGVSRAFNQSDGDDVLFNKSIGNYFTTYEEADKTVNKLKAWKRLQDRGFRFTGYNACSVDYDIDEQYRKYVSQELDLLFGDNN